MGALSSWKKLNSADLPNKLPSKVKKAIINFESYSNNFKDGNEWAQVTNVTKGKTYSIYTENKHNQVNPLIGDYSNDELIVCHNHPNGSTPSPNDIYNVLNSKLNIKYMVVHTNTNIFTVHFKKKPKDIKKFKEEFTKTYEVGMLEGSYEKQWIKFIKNKNINKYIDCDMVIK